MNIGENIRIQRIAHNMSQEDLSDLLDVSRQSISKWENGMAVPELEKLIKMSQTFGITLDELVGNTPPAAQPAAQTPTKAPAVYPARMIVGTALLCGAFLIFLLFTLFRDIEYGYNFAMPFALCGICCFVCSRHIGVFCGWALFLASANFNYSVKSYLHALSFSGFSNTFFLIFIALLIYTLIDYRKDPLVLDKRRKYLFIAGWVWVAAYLALRIWATVTNDGSRDSFVFLLNCAHHVSFVSLLTASLRLYRTKQ